jgi:hypothetical protein
MIGSAAMRVGCGYVGGDMRGGLAHTHQSS